MNKVHIIGISEQNPYPPLTDYLNNNRIPYFKSYDVKHITKDLDLVVIAGNALHVNPNNPEYLKAQELNLNITSCPEILSNHVIKPESIVVVGTYAKTTITAMLAKIFTQAGIDPSYKIGDLTLDFPDFIHTTSSQFSIAEGDEHPTLGYSTQPKFHYYQAKHLLLTSTLHDHFNIYPTEKEYIDIFKHAARKLPKDGLLLTSLEGAHNQQVAKAASCPTYTYSATNSQADFYASDTKITNSSTTFTFHQKIRHSDPSPRVVRGNNPLRSENTNTEVASSFPITLPLYGQHNVENAIGAIALSRLLKISKLDIQKALKNFQGLTRRLETKAEVNGITIIHDQGQLPAKIKAALEALRQKFPDRRIIAILDPYASVLHHHQSLKHYHHAFDATDQVIIARVFLRKLKPGQSKHLRVSGRRIRNAIKKTQPNVVYLPVDSQILKWLKENVKPGYVLVFFSTGPFRTLINDTIQMLKKTKTNND
jgi:UDP-N-acetylmuramate: L-alanyl-gamma-D-glutamyl-meso-diaminopimelate ligase